MRAVAYVRVSSEDQVKNLSLDTQEDACADYCEKAGLRLNRVFREEGKSAKSTDRPELENMLRYCRRKAGTITHVVVYDLKRFSRDLIGHYSIRGQLRNLGITLRSCTESMVNDTKEGKVMEAMVAAIAEYDNAARAERTIDGMRASVKAGRWPHRPPAGYLHNSDKTLSPDPRLAPLVAQAFEMAASGLYSQAGICRDMAAKGWTTRSGKPIASQSIRGILTNPAYIGRAKVGGKVGIDCNGGWEPLVSEELWHRVQGQLQKKGPSAVPVVQNREEFPLRGHIRCTLTGQPLTASWSRSKTGTRYGYYHLKKGRGIRVRREELHEAFLDLLKSLRPRPALAALWKASILDAWQSRHVEIRNHNRLLRRRVDELQQRKDKIVDLLMDGTIDSETYKRKVEALDQDLTLARIREAETAIEELDVESAIVYGLQLLKRADKIWLDANIDQRQRMQAVIFPEGLDFSKEEGFKRPKLLGIFTSLRLIHEKVPFEHPENEQVRTPLSSGNDRDLRAILGGEGSLVAHTGFEPVLPA